MCHYINDLLPLDDHPSYLQLYFYDTKHEVQNRLYNSNQLNPSILTQIIDILKVNPYCAFFRCLKNIPTLKDFHIHIRSDVALDQRVYNTPSTSQVAAIWVKETIVVETLLFIVILGVVIGYNTTLVVMTLYNILCYSPMEILVGIKEYKELKRERYICLLKLKY